MITTNSIEILTGECTNIPADPAITYPFTCDNFQYHSFNSIEKGNDVFVSVPTSAGKTVVAEYAIAHTIRKLKKKVIYTSPIKSLSNEKYNEFKTKFPDISVGLLTGDNKINIDGDLLIVTSEILRNSLFKLKEKIEDKHNQINEDFVAHLSCVIIDEIHYMDSDEDRGRVWEETIVLLDNSSQLIMLSATVGEPEKFAEWVSTCRQKMLSLITLTKRLIPLHHYIFIDDNLHMFLNENTYDSAQFNIAKKTYNIISNEREKQHKTKFDPNCITNLIKYLNNNNLLQALVFSFSRTNCEKYAHLTNVDLIDYQEREEINKIFDHHMSKFIKKYEHSTQVIEIKDLLNKGVAYHHSGLLPILKELIEIIFKKGLIKVLFCTETFAVGVNTPCRTVVFTELSKYTKKGQRFLTPAEYKQISGRAGRRGSDKTGEVIILPVYDFIDEIDLKNIVLGTVPTIQSKFKWDYQFFLKMRQSEKHSIDDFFKKSLININNDKMIRHIQEEIVKLENNINAFELVKSECKPTSLTNINKLLLLEDKQNIIFGNFKVSLNKKDLNEYKKLQKIINENPEQKHMYDLIISNNNNKNKLKKLTDDLTSYLDFVKNPYYNILNMLTKWGYIDSVKGIIASQINECNPILLTELITGEYLNNLNEKEIVAIVSLFTDSLKSGNFDSKYTIPYITDNVEDQINKLIDFKNMMEKDEENIVIISNLSTDWDLTIDNKYIAYKWAEGCSMMEITPILKSMNLYEGNFVKNMLKISNICHDIVGICKMIKKHDVLPILENIDNLILRDSVTINSLYF